MSSTKYFAVTAAVVAVTGAVWILSGGAPVPTETNSSFSSSEQRTQGPQQGGQAVPPSPQAQAHAMTIEALNPTSQDIQHLKVLDEILISKNDNDPRMDTELKDLSPASKRMMEDRYRSLPPERRNERGTIAFIVGREISSVEDVAFLGGILSESPCLSLGDCSREEKDLDNQHLHAETGSAVSLAYPQMVALHSIEGQIDRAEKGAKLSYLSEIRRVIEDASRSQIPIVADKARALQGRLKNLGSSS